MWTLDEVKKIVEEYKVSIFYKNASLKWNRFVVCLYNFLYKMNENWQEKRIKGLIDELKTENQKSEALEEKLEQYHKKLQQEKEEIKQEIYQKINSLRINFNVSSDS